jgi:UDP-N-acetylmuramate: L-alanyl-gamma-D-glutamyl-meso-diaminopimelate ligase
MLAPLGRTNVPAGERLDLDRLVRDLGPKARAMPSVDGMVARLVDEARAGDTVALLSNGAFDGIHAKIMSALVHRG